MSIVMRCKADNTLHIVENADGYGDEAWENLGDPGDRPLSLLVYTDGALGVDLAPAWVAVRAERDRRLTACDWTQLGDQAEARRTAWKAYRQSLRDLPANTTDPTKPTWPATPE